MVDNTVTIVGNLTADPEVRVTDGGATLAEIRIAQNKSCLLYTSPSPRDRVLSRMPSSA